MPGGLGSALKISRGFTGFGFGLALASRNFLEIDHVQILFHLKVWLNSHQPKARGVGAGFASRWAPTSFVTPDVAPFEGGRRSAHARYQKLRRLNAICPRAGGRTGSDLVRRFQM